MGAQTAALPRAVPEDLGLKAVLGDWQPLTPPSRRLSDQNLVEHHSGVEIVAGVIMDVVASMPWASVYR